MAGASSRSEVLNQLPHIGIRSGQLLPSDAGEREDIVNQMPHSCGAIPYHLQEPPALCVQLVRIILQQDIREAVDCAQRRTKIVRHGIGKGLQFLVGSRQPPDGPLQIVRPCRDELFEVLTMLQQRQLIAQCDNAELQIARQFGKKSRFLLVKPVRSGRIDHQGAENVMIGTQREGR